MSAHDTRDDIGDHIFHAKGFADEVVIGLPILPRRINRRVAAAVVNQLAGTGVEIRRMGDALTEGAPDPVVLAYALENGYALLTHDEQITRHIATRHKDGKGHAGMFIAGRHLQGRRGIGTIVTFILEYHALIAAGAGTVKDDVYNQTIYI